MKTALNKSVATHSPSVLEEGKVLGDGWRIKERKTDHPDEITFHASGPDRIKQENASEKIARAPGHDESTQHRSWCHPVGVLVSIGAIVVVLTMLADVPSSWLEKSGVAQPANAETYASSTPTQDQKTTVHPAMPNSGYQLHLGTYRSELGARLMWASLEADSDTLLDGFDPSFERQKSDGGTFYNVLAGTYARHGIADNHCAWLNKREIACSVIGGK